METATLNKSGPGHGTLRVQSILYGNDPERIMQTVAHLERAAKVAITGQVIQAVELAYGDSSAEPALRQSDLEKLRGTCQAVSHIEYRFFNKNMGSAAGQNALLSEAKTDLLLVMNPDVMLAPDALIELVRPLARPDVGMVEARQLPIEHPKEYDVQTGETPWATTACLLISVPLIKKLNGFDAESFFLYCDDLDLCWRARLAGYKVIYQPSAAVYHDKRLSETGDWMPSGAEQYYSGEAALMLAHKYSREDIVSELLKTFSTIDIDHLKRAANEYCRRKEAGLLPTPIDPKHKVGYFSQGLYARHRFSL